MPWLRVRRVELEDGIVNAPDAVLDTTFDECYLFLRQQ